MLAIFLTALTIVVVFTILLIIINGMPHTGIVILYWTAIITSIFTGIFLLVYGDPIAWELFECSSK